MKFAIFVIAFSLALCAFPQATIVNGTLVSASIGGTNAPVAPAATCTNVQYDGGTIYGYTAVVFRYGATNFASPYVATVANPCSVVLSLKRVGVLTNNLRVSIYGNNSGVPGTNSSDWSAWTNCASIATNAFAEYTFEIANASIATGTNWVVAALDSAPYPDWWDNYIQSGFTYDPSGTLLEKDRGHNDPKDSWLPAGVSQYFPIWKKVLSP